jgi:hypothetical protein
LLSLADVCLIARFAVGPCHWAFNPKWHGLIFTPPPYKYGVIQVRVSKLAKILHTSTLDYIFDDSEDKNSVAGQYRPVGSTENREKRKNHNFRPGFATLSPYCCPMEGSGGPKFLFSDF